MSVCRGTLRNALSVKIKLDKPFVLFLLMIVICEAEKEE